MFSRKLTGRESGGTARRHFLWRFSEVIRSHSTMRRARAWVHDRMHGQWRHPDLFSASKAEIRRKYWSVDRRYLGD